MYYSECSVGYVLRLEAGEEIQESLRYFSEHVSLMGAFYQGVGSLNRAELGFFRSDEQRYDRCFLEGNFNLVYLAGNLSRLDEMMIPHSHACLADCNYRAIAGHLMSGVVSVTVELLITTINIPLMRKEDPALKFHGLFAPNYSHLKTSLL